MYKINEKCVKELSKYNLTKVAEIVGIHKTTLYSIKSGTVIKEKKVAYCITKFLNSEKEIEDCFDYVEREE